MNPNSLKNIKPGFKATGSFTYEVEGLVQAAQAIQAIPTAIRKNASEQASRNMKTLADRAESIFYSDIRRPGQQGVDAFSKGRSGRQTGNFTFGESGTGAFVGSVVETEDGVGFGWPNIDHADDATNRVWRTLEYGLDGKKHSARPLLPENAGLVPTGQHRLPKGFQFSTPYTNPTGYMYPSSKRRDQDGGGIEGKHFIEGAWLEIEGLISDRYVRSVTDAVAAFGR